MGKTILTRLQLYQLVWQQPVSQLAKQLGVSPATLTNGCRRVQIPLPERGYWQKRAAGHSLAQPPLAEGPGMHFEISFRLKPAAVSVTKNTRTNIDTCSEKACALSKLSNPHPLIMKARNQLKDQHCDVYGMRKASPIPGLSIRVSDATEVRALRIIDTIFKRLLKAHIGIEDRVRDNLCSRRNRCFTVGGDEVECSIHESYLRRQKSDAERQKEISSGKQGIAKVVGYPTGKLRLTMENRFSRYRCDWTDNTIPLEAQVGEVVQALQALPEMIQRRRNQLNENARIWEAEHQSQFLRQQLVEQQQAYLQDLLAEARSYRECIELHAYLDHLEMHFKEQEGGADLDRFRQKIKEARQLAAGLDYTDKRIHQIKTDIAKLQP
jgi:hypothetical protein